MIERSNILIFGTGAIGSALGGFLTRSGHSVYLYGRSRHLNRIRKNGLKIRGIFGTHTFRSFAGTFTRFDRLKHSRLSFDLILVTVKSFDTETAAREIKQIASPNSLILSVQNGLGNIEILHRHFPPKQVLAARAIFGVVLEPGAIDITVWGGPILVGKTAGEKADQRAAEIAALFSRCGLCSKAVPDVRKSIWGKVIYNSALNPLAAFLEVPYGALLKSGETKMLMQKVIQEIYAVARKKKAALEPKTSAGYVRLLFGKLIPDTARHYPSMFYDLKRGKKTEIDALNGAISKFGVKWKVRTPVNDFLTALIKAKEAFSAGSDT